MMLPRKATTTKHIFLMASKEVEAWKNVIIWCKSSQTKSVIIKETVSI